MRVERGLEAREIGGRDRDRSGRGLGTFSVENEAVGEHQVAGFEPFAERSRKAGCNHEVCR